MTRGASFRIGLIGLGRHGQRYARHLAGDVPNATLVAIARRHPDQALPDFVPDDLPRYDDPERLIADERVDAVVAVVPPVLNARICAAAARARKPVLVEKPMAPDAALAREIAATARAHAGPVMVAHTLRYNRAIRAVRELLPCLGPPRRLLLTLTVPPRARPAGNPEFLGRGPLVDLGVHLLDLLHWWLAPAVLTTTCRITDRTAEGVDTGATATIETNEGCACVLRLGWEGEQSVGEGWLEGDRGSVRVDWLAHRLESQIGQEPPVAWTVEEAPAIPQVLRDFLDAAERRTPMPISAEDGLRAVLMAEACYEAAETARAVTLDL